MQVDFNQVISKTVLIDADSAKIWKLLTIPRLMQNWMLDDGKIAVVTDWKIGLPIVIKGDMHGIPFENRGVVKQFEPENLLQYSHLSSLSLLPDVIASYTIFTFELTPKEGRTLLSLTLNNFPTFEIYKHLDFYWNVTLPIIKAFAEMIEPN